MSRAYPPIYSIRYEVTIGGTAYTEADGRVADLVVESTLDGADRVSFTFNSRFDPETSTFSDLDWETFSTGTTVDVRLGWGGQGEMRKLFTGHIRSLSTSFSGGKGPTVSVSGYGLTHEMTRGTKDKTWTDKTVGEVVTKVLENGGYFSEKEVKDPGMKRPKIEQNNVDDYTFVRDLADKYGYRFYSERDKASFKPRSSMGQASPVATLRYGGKLDSFTGELNESTKVKKVEVRYWDMQDEKEVVGSASTDAKTDKKEVFRMHPDSKNEADEIAKSKLSKLSRARVEGDGETRGIPALTAGATVELANMGDRFSRNYYVKKATHRIGSSGYTTSFSATEVPQ